MEIGTDDFDFDGLDESLDLDDSNTSFDLDDGGPKEGEDINDDIEPQPQETNSDFVSFFLKAHGIQNPNRISFQDDEGNLQEMDWNSLDNETKHNIINSFYEEKPVEYTDKEKEFIEKLRQDRLTPKEYTEHIGKLAIEKYIKENSASPEYSVDSYSDDELFVADLANRMPDLTEEEALEALEKIKENPTLFERQIGAIRKHYKQLEDENNKRIQEEKELQEQEQITQFNNSITEAINGFTEYAGYTLNMDKDDVNTLYDFITGQDAAGNNHFVKTLSDPASLVKTAWLALNGQRMLEDITNYFQKEITNVRKASYEKGKADAKKDGYQVVRK